MLLAAGLDIIRWGPLIVAETDGEIFGYALRGTAVLPWGKKECKINVIYWLENYAKSYDNYSIYFGSKVYIFCIQIRKKIIKFSA